MREPYYAAAYWVARPEPAERCARRAASFFQLLSACHPDYARWYEQTSSARGAAPVPFTPTVETFARFFGQKKYQADSEGFSFGAWTGHGEDQGGMVLIGCGASAPGATNLAQLYLPSEPPGRDDLVTRPILTQVMRALVMAWEPDWAVATPRDLREQLSRTGRPGTFLGWMTYFSRHWGDVPPLPAPVRLEPVEDKGTLILLAPERLDSMMPEHVTLARQAQATLEARGLMRPLVHKQGP